MSKVHRTEAATLSALHRVFAARKEAALAELAYVEIAEAQLAELELEQSQQAMDDEIRQAALKVRDEMYNEPGPRLVVNVDDTPVDAVTEPAPDRQAGKAHSEFGAMISDEPEAPSPELELRREPYERHPKMVPVVVEDERARRKAGR